MGTDPFRLPLEGTKVVSLAVNLPGPVAAAKLRALGAQVLRIEPPTGDPLKAVAPAYYERLIAGQNVARLDLKSQADRKKLDEALGDADLLVTSSRRQSLQGLGLGWDDLHKKHPRLNQVAIFGYPASRRNESGHDLTYQATAGLLSPPHLPITLVADFAGALEATEKALALLLARQKAGQGGYAEVTLSESVAVFAEPLAFGLTGEGKVLGGGIPNYELYEASEGWVAVAALEPHFWKKLQAELGLKAPTAEKLRTVFKQKNAREWEQWAAERELPIAAVREIRKE